MSTFGLAVVGAGRAGLVHAVNAQQWLGGAGLTCIVDADDATARRVGEELGVPAFISLDAALDRGTFDGVVITTPTFTHCDLTIQAAQAGKHVFCEKPMALTVEECDRMTDVTSASGVVFQMGFVRRFQREFAEAKARIEAGEIGRPIIVKSLTRGPGLPPPWAHDLALSNGMLAEVNSHDFDCVRWLVGSEIRRVYAETANVKGASRGVEADNFYDNAVVALRFESGALGTIDGTCPADYGYDARVEVVGTDGLIVIGAHERMSLLEVRTKGTGETPTFESWPQRFEWGYREELRAFVEAATEGRPAAVGGADGRAAVAAVQAANRSWLDERPVEVDRPVNV